MKIHLQLWQDRLQEGSVLLRISQMSPLFGVRTLQNISATFAKHTRTELS